MSQIVIVTVLLAVAGLLLLLNAGAQVLIARRRRPGAAVGMLLLRLLTLGILGALLWKVFWSREVVDEKEDEARRPERHVVVLQDASNSMAFEAAGGRTRATLADAAWRELRAAAEDAPGKVIAERHLFARNLVPEAERERLAPDSTQLGAAIVTALSRLDLDSMVVVSDGAATDGPVPPYLLQWAANRGIRIYGIAVGEPGEQVDVAVGEVFCRRHNPESIAARLVVNGRVEGQLAVEFSIDRGAPQILRLDPTQETEASIRVPELPVGWHEFAVQVAPVPGEVTELNNIQRGIFHVAPPNRLLVLYDTPRLETLHLVRLARQRFPERVTVMSVNDPSLQDLDPQRFLLTVLADVPSEKVPERWLDPLRRGQNTVLLLYGDHFDEWTTRRLPALPIVATGETLNLARLGREAAFLRVDHRAAGPAFEYLETSGLTVDILGQIRPAPAATVLVNAVSGARNLPLVVTDDPGKPKVVAVLAETTWKWALHPDPVVRGRYRTFWATILAWAVGETASEFQLEIDFEAAEAGSDATDIVIRPRVGEVADYRDVELRIAGEPGPFEPRPAGEQWVYRFTHPTVRPAVVWCQARASRRGEAVQSERRPLLLSLDAAELLDTAPHPERLAALCPDHPERFAPYGDHKKLIARVFDELQPNLRPRHRRRRQPGLELTLVAIIILLLAGEWFVERALKQNPPGVGRD